MNIRLQIMQLYDETEIIVLIKTEENKMKTIAWNVDTQYDFMRPDGKLYVQGAEAIEPNLERLTELFKEKGIQTVNTADRHYSSSAELSDNPDFKDTFPEHCMAGTSGADYITATRPSCPLYVDWLKPTVNLEAVASAREVVLYKDAFDIFKGNPHADSVVEAINPDRVIVYGVATDYCVNYAVKGLAQRGVEVLVVEDAIKELGQRPAELGWKELGVKMIRTEDVHKYV